MTYYTPLSKRYKMIYSDTHFKPSRKKPTISIYDAEENLETKIASFNSQETFEWFCEFMSGKKEKAESEGSNADSN